MAFILLHLIYSFKIYDPLKFNPFTMEKKYPYKFINTVSRHEYVNYFFNFFGAMVKDNRIEVKQFIDEAGIFKPIDFRILCEQIPKDQQVRMNTSQATIFYAIIYFISSKLLDKKEEIYFRKFLQEDASGFVAIKDKLLSFGNVITKLLQNKLLKDDGQFLSAVKNIQQIDILN